MSGLAPVNNKAVEPRNPTPNTDANRHFVDPGCYAGVDDEEGLKTRTLTSHYKLPRTWVAFQTDLLSIPYKHCFKVKNPSRYMHKHNTYIRVQNLPHFTTGSRDIEYSPTTICGMVATAITALIDDAMKRSIDGMKGSDSNVRPYFAKVVDVQSSSIKHLNFQEFKVIHMGDDYLPLDKSYDRIYYPILMDRTGLHHATTDASHAAMITYTEAFSKVGKKGRMMMSQADRHYLTDGLPSKCLNIQVVGWE